MKRFRVDGGVARLGPAQLVGLTPAQFALREGRVDLVKQLGDKLVLAKTRELLEFKLGEVIALDELPRHLASILAPLEKVETPVEKIAADHAAGRRAAKKRAAPAAD
jgi:hypothetical protein